MDATARITSKGQVTIPKEVRDALDLKEGDSLHFRVEKSHAVVAKNLSLDELAGSVPVPPEKRGMSWDEIVKETRRVRARKYRP